MKKEAWIGSVPGHNRLLTLLYWPTCTSSTTRYHWTRGDYASRGRSSRFRAVLFGRRLRGSAVVGRGRRGRRLRLDSNRRRLIRSCRCRRDRRGRVVGGRRCSRSTCCLFGGGVRIFRRGSRDFLEYFFLSHCLGNNIFLLLLQAAIDTIIIFLILFSLDHLDHISLGMAYFSFLKLARW